MTRHKSTPIFLLSNKEFHGPFEAERSAHRYAEAFGLANYNLYFKPLPLTQQPRFIPLERTSS
jgi:hypothetical protein